MLTKFKIFEKNDSVKEYYQIWMSGNFDFNSMEFDSFNDCMNYLLNTYI